MVLRTAEPTWTCSSWASALGPNRAAGTRPWAPWHPSTWRSLPPGVGVGGAHHPTPGSRSQHSAVRGLAQPGTRIQGWPGPCGLDPISLCVGPGAEAQINPNPHRAQGQASPDPHWLGAGVLCRVCTLNEGQWAEAGHSGSSAPLTCTHPVGGSLSSLLPVTPGYSMGHPGF